MNRASLIAVLAASTIFCGGIGITVAQPVDTTPSRQTVQDAAQQSCDGVSVVVQRCAAKADDTTPQKAGDDALAKSRAATKAAFDRRDKRARDAALDGSVVPANTPVGDAQRLGGVTVTGQASDNPLSVEDILQRALNPGTGEVPGPNGTVSRFGPDGTRYDCIAKCVGPACCATIRSLPNPARESNSIGR
ncbi:MAG: hypothetical protein ABI277_17125 [Burkholderiaceae bacterium]